MKIIPTENKTRERIIEVDSVEEGIALMHDFNNSNEQRGYRFSLLMLDENTGTIRLYERFNQPCIGEMRTYGPNSTRPNDPRPGDLYTPFPDGTPIAVGHPYTLRNSCNLHYDLLTDPIISPYADALKSFEWTKNSKGEYSGIIITDTSVDSTLLVSFLRNIRYFEGYDENYVQKILKILGEENKYLYPVLVFSSILSAYAGHQIGTNSNEKILNYINKKWDTSLTGGTFKERYAYNRPQIDYIWGTCYPKNKFYFSVSIGESLNSLIERFVQTFGSKENTNVAA